MSKDSLENRLSTGVPATPTRLVMPDTAAVEATEYRPDSQFPLVSIVIPALNEERTIGKCLEALCQMVCESPSFEVIVVDNGSVDGTVDIAARYGTQLDLRILARPGVHISAARNFGAGHARGTVLAFLDADCIAPPNWISSLISRVQTTGGSAIVGARYRIPRDSSWVATAWYRDSAVNKIGEVSYVPAGNMIVSRRLFTALGGFDESIQTNEDSEFCHRARSLGFSTQAFSEIAVEHLGTPQTLSSFYKKQRWHGQDVFNVFVRTRGVQNTKVVVLAVITLTAIMGIVAGLAIAISVHNPVLLVVSIAVLLAAPVGLGVRSAIKQKSVACGAAIALLTFIYATARCRCLLDVRPWVLLRRLEFSGREKRNGPGNILTR